MQEDFHYYATYCAAIMAGYSHEDSMQICYSAQFVDLCSQTFLSVIGGPKEAATTQLNLELMDTKTTYQGLREITSIWSGFHFLPYDLDVKLKGKSRLYTSKYRLICNPNSDLLVDTVHLAKDKDLQAVGIAMHVLADTWAHRYFAGTPSLVINNTDEYFYEIIRTDKGEEERKITFKHSTTFQDDIEHSVYVNSLYQFNENAIMNLGHGRAGHLPDYSFIKYKYLPAWMDYEEIVKDNPDDYMHAFAQMVYALKYFRGEEEEFRKDTYDFVSIEPYRERIDAILRKRQTDASADWKAFGEELSKSVVEPFDLEKYTASYKDASKDEKKDTFLGRFFTDAVAQKRMVSEKIFAKRKKSSR